LPLSANPYLKNGIKMLIFREKVKNSNELKGQKESDIGKATQ
jgi:hypothetical protein